MLNDSEGRPEGDEPITAEWLAEVGFKWHQLDRQPDKHWLLWLNNFEGSEFEALGIELAPSEYRGDWYCWLRSDTAHRYCRFIHVRHIRTRDDLRYLFEGLTGQPFKPVNFIGGSARTASVALRYRMEDSRLDRAMLKHNPAWHEVEKDDSMGGALPEHLQAHHDQRKEADRA